MKGTIKTPPPIGFCDLCREGVLQQAPRMDIHSGEAMTAYCEHNRVGGVWIPALRFWQLATPVGPEWALKRAEQWAMTKQQAETAVPAPRSRQ
jgi:hypothetical protein